MKDKGKKACEGKAAKVRDARRPSQGGRRARKRVQTAAEAQARETVVIAHVDADTGQRSQRAVERRLDILAVMRKRRQIDARQRQAGDTWDAAYQAMMRGIPSALDMSRGGSGIGHSPAPSETALWGAQVMADAARILGLMDDALLHKVLGEGFSLEQAAAVFYGVTASGKASRSHCELTGQRFRDALRLLADQWYPVRKARIVASSAGQRALAEFMDEGQGEVSQARWAHAGGGRVFYSDDEEDGR